MNLGVVHDQMASGGSCRRRMLFVVLFRRGCDGAVVLASQLKLLVVAVDAAVGPLVVQALVEGVHGTLVGRDRRHPGVGLHEVLVETARSIVQFGAGVGSRNT